MLKVRVIPTLLWKSTGLVKGTAFDSWRRVGSVMPAVKVYNRRAVDELILVDITANIEGRVADLDEVDLVADECFVPLAVGGGISRVEDVRALLRAGADKVCINTAALREPSLISAAATRFGSQCIVVSIDARASAGGYECYSHSGAHNTGRDPADWALEAEALGAGELLVTSIDRDGTMSGYDLDLIERVASRVRIPVIASGGCGDYEHMARAVLDAGASAVAAASIFHFTEKTPLEAKRYLASRGVNVRLDSTS